MATISQSSAKPAPARRAGSRSATPQPLAVVAPATVEVIDEDTGEVHHALPAASTALAAPGPAALPAVIELSNQPAIMQWAQQFKSEAVRIPGLILTFNNEEFVSADGWKYFGARMGLSAMADEPKLLVNTPEERKYAVRVVIVNVHTGMSIGAASGVCTSKEKGRERKSDHDLMAMAQTRGVRSAFRAVLGWVPRVAGLPDSADPEAAPKVEKADDELKRLLMAAALDPSMGEECRTRVLWNLHEVSAEKGKRWLEQMTDHIARARAAQADSAAASAAEATPATNPTPAPVAPATAPAASTGAAPTASRDAAPVKPTKTDAEIAVERQLEAIKNDIIKLVNSPLFTQPEKKAALLQAGQLPLIDRRELLESLQDSHDIREYDKTAQPSEPMLRAVLRAKTREYWRRGGCSLDQRDQLLRKAADLDAGLLPDKIRNVNEKLAELPVRRAITD